MDGPGGHSVQEVHISLRCLELRSRHVGSHVIRGAAILELVKPGCHQIGGQGIPATPTDGKAWCRVNEAGFDRF